LNRFNKIFIKMKTIILVMCLLMLVSSIK